VVRYVVINENIKSWVLMKRLVSFALADKMTTHLNVTVSESIAVEMRFAQALVNVDAHALEFASKFATYTNLICAMFRPSYAACSVSI